MNELSTPLLLRQVVQQLEAIRQRDDLTEIEQEDLARIALDLEILAQECVAKPYKRGAK